MRIKVFTGVFGSALLTGCGPNVSDYRLPEDFCVAERRWLSDEEKILRVLFDIEKGKYDESHAYKTKRPEDAYQNGIQHPKLNDLEDVLYKPTLEISLKENISDDEIRKKLNLIYVQNISHRIRVMPPNYYGRIVDNYFNDKPPPKDIFQKIGYVKDLYFLNISDLRYLDRQGRPRALPFLLTNCGEIFKLSMD